ncbi:MAG: ABC transporter ATP-binding protein [Deltaproteobacteria bacterium]|nr:MAG: ABC transporter ATP-binding protein [Deltaproteobacteria bacterium]
MLRIDKVDVSYGSVRVLHGISFHMDKGECLALLGSNGAGKSTILKTISGLLNPDGGSIVFMEERIDHLPTFEVAKAGIAHVPEGRRVFPQLSVEENLDMGSYLPEAKKQRKRTKEWVYSIFPVLEERRRQMAGTLSGGEQQMMAIGRGLMLKPRLLMLDEPSLGLAPIITDGVYEKLGEIRKQGVSILLVEQDVLRALGICDRGYVLKNGRIHLEGAREQLLADSEIKSAYLGM